MERYNIAFGLSAIVIFLIGCRMFYWLYNYSVENFPIVGKNKNYENIFWWLFFVTAYVLTNIYLLLEGVLLLF